MTTPTPADRWLGQALNHASSLGHMFCTVEHLLAVLLATTGPQKAFDRVQGELAARRRMATPPPAVKLSASLRRFMSEYIDEQQSSSRSDDAEDLVKRLLGADSLVDDALKSQLVRYLMSQASDENQHTIPATPRPKMTEPEFLRAWTPGHSLIDAVDRPQLVDQILRSLMYDSALVVGPEGSGRRTLVQLCARRLCEGPVPSALGDRDLLFLDPVALMAGTTYRGELEERVQTMLCRVRQASAPPIVIVSDLGQLVGTGRADGTTDIASAIKNDLEVGSFRLLACASEQTFRERIEVHPSLAACFRLVRMPDISATEAGVLLQPQVARWRESHQIEAPSTIVEDAISLARQYAPQMALPGSARQILDEAVSAHSYETGMLALDPSRRSSRYWSIVAPEWQDETPPCTICERHLMNAVAELHRIPIEHLESDIERRIEDLHRAYHDHIFGQDHVFDVLHRKTMVSLLGMSEPRYPRGRLFFLGPPGTGKSETARLMARHLMGSEDALLRFNMGEYSSESGVASLIGADKGLVNAEEGGRLTEPVRCNPRRVLLFDEIEKAHPKVFDIFLAILEDGECQDKRNLPVSFRHTICIFTSNAGGDGTAESYPTDEAEIVDLLSSTFRREFLDRIDAFLTFGALGQVARRRVAEHHLDRCRAQFLAVHGVHLEWTEDVLQSISEPREGRPGVRDIIRWVQAVVKPAVCERILSQGRSNQLQVVLGCDDSGQIHVQDGGQG